jgi:hypothetical protein
VAAPERPRRRPPRASVSGGDAVSARRAALTSGGNWRRTSRGRSARRSGETNRDALRRGFASCGSPATCATRGSNARPNRGCHWRWRKADERSARGCRRFARPQPDGGHGDEVRCCSA